MKSCHSTIQWKSAAAIFLLAGYLSACDAQTSKSTQNVEHSGASSIDQQSEAIMDFLLPKERFLKGNLLALESRIFSEMRMDPQSDAILQANGDLQELIRSIVRREGVEILENDYPVLRKNQKDVLLGIIKPEDYPIIINFLKSSAAIKQREGSYGDENQAKFRARIAELRSKGLPVSGQDIELIRNEAAAAGSGALTPQEIEMNTAFRISEAGKRFFLAQREMRPITMAWAASSDSKLGPMVVEINDAVEKWQNGGR